MDTSLSQIIGQMATRRGNKRTYTLYISEEVMEGLRERLHVLRPTDPPPISSVIEEILVAFMQEIDKPRATES